MATLKKLTRMGADVRQIARLLQAKAPEGHMLAYITPDEAKLLKSQGGSGHLHEDTGVPSFEVDDSYGFTADTAFDYGPEPTQAYSQPTRTYSVDATAPIGPRQTDSGTPIEVMESAPSVPGIYGGGGADPYTKGTSEYMQAKPSITEAAGQSRISQGEAPYSFQDMSFAGENVVPGGYLPTAMTMGAGEPAPQTIDTAREPSLGDKLQSYYKDMSPQTLTRLGLAGGLGLLGAYQSNKAQKEAERAKKEQQALAAPYQQKGAELQRAAQAGELTPAAQQQLQAVQAQAAQQAASRGGAVGQAQTQAQVEAFRSQLLAQQYDYGLKLSGIGDQVALGAIKTGLEADRYVQSLSNGFYTNMANIVGGMPAQPQRTA